MLLHSQDRLLASLAGYRNRMVHFYHEVTFEELYEICRGELGDLLKIRNAFVEWIRNNSDQIDETL